MRSPAISECTACRMLMTRWPTVLMTRNRHLLLSNYSQERYVEEERRKKKKNRKMTKLDFHHFQVRHFNNIFEQS